MSTPLHVVVLTYTAGLDEIDAAIAAHTAWLDANYADYAVTTFVPSRTAPGTPWA